METSITIRISEKEKEKIKALAKEQDLSASQLIRKLIKEYLAQN